VNGIEETGAGVKQNAILQRREQERKKKEWTLGTRGKKKLRRIIHVVLIGQKCVCRG